MLIIRNIDQDRENINPKSLQPGSHPPHNFCKRQTESEESQEWADCPHDDCSSARSGHTFGGLFCI